MSSNEATQQQDLSREHRKRPCVLCQQRKVKCDRNEPCRNCILAGVACVSAATLPPRKRKRRFPEAVLLARLRIYEHHLRAYGADLDAINNEGTRGEECSTTDSLSIRDTPTNLHPGPQSFGHDVDLGGFASVKKAQRHVETLSLGVSDEYRDAEVLLGGASDDEVLANPISETFEEHTDHEGDLLFPVNTSANVNALHPSPVLIFRLWQTFLDNVDPLIKIFHAPTVQQKVLDATADLGNIPKNTEALLFSIYAAATMSMDDEWCQKLFEENKTDLLARFHSGAQQALRNAGCLRSSDFVVLQAFTLYVLSCLSMSMEPRTLFCFTGIIVRIAQRMGLSTDGTHYTMPPFEVEMRRRLWWQIVLLDHRVAEVSGAEPSIVMHTWDTKLPANTDDSALFPDMKTPPVEGPGITEMMFVRLRCEVLQVVQQTKARTGDYALGKDAIEDLEQRLERVYWQHCDPTIPLHLMSLMTSKSSITKLRISLRQPIVQSNSRRFSQTNKSTLFQFSLQMLEYYNTLIRSPSVQQFTWYMLQNYPFPAHIYLAWLLRDRTNDELADHAWHQLSESAEARMKFDKQPFFIKKRHKTILIQLALANLTVKAWEAREATFQSTQKPPPVPRFISLYRNMILEDQSQKGTATTDSTPYNFDDQSLERRIASIFPVLDPNTFGMVQGYGQSMTPGMTPSTMESSVFQNLALPAALPSMGWGSWNETMPPENLMDGVDTTMPYYNNYSYES